MLKTEEKLLITIHRIIDIIVVGLSFFAAFKIRTGISGFPLEPFRDHIENYLWLFLVLVFLMWNLLFFNKVYISYRGKPKRLLFWAIIKAHLQGVLFIGFILFFLQEYWIHRTLIIIFFTVCGSALILEKTILLIVLRSIRKHDKNLKNALIIGTGKRAKSVAELLRVHVDAGFRLIGFLGNKTDYIGNKIEGIPVLGLSKDFQNILLEHVVDEVFIAISIRSNKEISEIIAKCEEYGINVRIMANIFKPSRASLYIDELLNMPFISFTTKPEQVFQLFLKDSVDIFVALIFNFFLLPLFFIIAILVKLDSAGPVFFCQERTGLNGRKFIIYKFRSMVEDAEAQKSGLEISNEMDGPVFKIKNDMRITRLGRFLRKTSLDELPQLFNVLQRDMSLIGPRPLPTYESEKILGVARRRLSMKPGITGLWQVSGRNLVDFDKWMKLDLEYIDDWSLWLDVKILSKTLYVWLSGRGAY